MAPSPPTPPKEDFPRLDGLVVLIGLVVVGIGVTSAFFMWQAPKARAEFDASIAAEPTSSEGRIERWMDYGGPIIHSRLRQLRLSGQQPWLVTHVVEAADGGDPRVWGIDLTEVSPDIVRREDMTVFVRLPQPRFLLRARIVGDNADRVPRVPHDGTPPDPRERARFLARYMLEETMAALERDIPGARLVIEVEGDE